MSELGSNDNSSSDGEVDDAQELDVIRGFEDMFKDRYSDKDEDYTVTANHESEPAPCVENWYSRPKRSYDWTRQQDQRGRGRGDQRDGYHGNRGNYQGNREYPRDNRGGYHDNRRDSHDRGPSRAFYAGMKDDNPHQRDNHHYGDRHQPYGQRGGRDRHSNQGRGQGYQQR